MLTVIIVVFSLKSKYVYAEFCGCCVSELYVHQWPEAVYRYFTRIMYDQS